MYFTASHLRFQVEPELTHRVKAGKAQVKMTLTAPGEPRHWACAIPAKMSAEKSFFPYKRTPLLLCWKPYYQQVLKEHTKHAKCFVNNSLFENQAVCVWPV